MYAISFDDAYSSLSAILPAVKRDEIPITIFVNSGYMQRGATFWWDRIDDLFPCVPTDAWRNFEDELGVPTSYRQGQPVAFGPLRPLRQWLLATYLGRWPPELEAMLQSMETAYGCKTRQAPMAARELNHVAELPTVHLGVHTVSHPVLPLLSDTESHAEIANCAETLQARFPHVCPILAVPFGLYDRRTVRIARSAGMIASLSLANRPLSGFHPKELLPRLSITRGTRMSTFWLRRVGLAALVPRRLLRLDDYYPQLPSART